MGKVPLVDYLVLSDEPHLVAKECNECKARFFGRRNGCAACGATELTEVELSTTGVVQTFTIIERAAPGVKVPFVPAVVSCDGTAVKGNIINTPPDVDHVQLGMKVRLATYSIGTDADGNEAIAYGFEPLD